MVDIHSHILPNIDDGAKDIAEALEMGRIAVNEGINHIIATPHYLGEGNDPTKEEITKKIDDINKLYQQEGINLNILPGNEVYLNLDIVEHIKNGNILTLNESKYILVEFPMNSVPLYAEDVLYEIRILGYIPIIAHPERYNQVIIKPEIVRSWVEQGNLIQINSLSILGKMGSRTKETARYLLKNNLVHFIATDSHSAGTRSPKIKEALSQVESWVGIEQKNQIIHNSAAIITGNKVGLIEKKLKNSKKGFFFNFSWANILK